MEIVAWLVENVVGLLPSLVIAHLIIGHLEEGNPGHSWTSSALVVFVPPLVMQVGALLLGWTAVTIGMPVLALPGFGVAVVGAFLVAAWIIRKRYELGWLHAAVFFIAIWILSALAGMLMMMVLGPILFAVQGS